jgi:hypothetical protein
MLNQKQNSYHHEFISKSPEFESILTASTNSLRTIFSSYSGIIAFCMNDLENLHSLLSPLNWYINIVNHAHKPSCDQLFAGSFLSCSTKNEEDHLLTRTEEIRQREIKIINNLLSFFYEIFNIVEITEKDVLNEVDATTAATFNSNFKQQQQQYDRPRADSSLDDDFILNECDGVFELAEKIQSQSKNKSVKQENNSSNSLPISSNLNSCLKVFILKFFIEAGFFESLLNLYFGLPLSCMQNKAYFSNINNQNDHSCEHKSIKSLYLDISFKVLHLFAEFYVLTNNIFSGEFIIEDLVDLSDDTIKTNKFYFTTNGGIHTELRKFALISYLNKLNNLEREREVLTYLTEFNRKREAMKYGITLPTEQIAKLTFSSQQFLAHSYFFSNDGDDIGKMLKQFKDSKHHDHNEILTRSNFRRTSLKNLNYIF